MTRIQHLALAPALALGCASAPPLVPTVRFVNAPPVVLVDDRRDVPEPPKQRRVLVDYYTYDSSILRPMQRALEVPRGRRARGVNAIDEVPDSTWFTNRRGLTPDQIRSGPMTLDSPEHHLPWTIESTQIGGTSVGFVVHDARGIEYLMKFDDRDFAEIETGADVVVNRLLWAAGFNVPENQVVFVRRDELRLAPDAVRKDPTGHAIGRLDSAAVVEQLAKAAREPDGRLRALASRWLAGQPLGPPPVEGVRKDDPNDLIAHEDRRDVRGRYSIFAWLDVTDIVPGNYLDMWVADPGDADHHYVKHYAVDFGSSLSVMAAKGFDLGRGFVYRIDPWQMFSSALTFGLLLPEYYDRPLVAIAGVAAPFGARVFEPDKWKPDLPFVPFSAMDRFDAFWGAKIVAAFTREQIHAAVEAGRYGDPRAVEYITDTLVARQRKIAAFWYARVNPLERFEMEDDFCFDDLAIAEGYALAGPTRYVIAAYDAMGHPITEPFEIGASPDGHTCTMPSQLAYGSDNYTILSVTTMRGGFRGTTYVHLARDYQTDRKTRVIGLWRI